MRTKIGKEIALGERFPPATRLATLLLVLVAPLATAHQRQGIEVTSARPFLRWGRPAYHNYALEQYSNYPNHTVPYHDAPRTFYGPIGNELITGYDLYSWNETRQPGQEYGSSIFKPNIMYNLVWEKVCDATVIGRDGYGNWGYSLMVADNMIAHLSPLTMSKTDFAGFRLDVSLPRLKLSAMASRIERPHVYTGGPTIWSLDMTHFANDSTLLLGGRMEAEAGLARLGLNFANSHVYRSTQSGNSMKGVLRPDQPLMDWVIVRFSDDSPADGSDGAVVQQALLYIDGRPRPDLRPAVIRHRAGTTPQVGSASVASGRFRAVDYTVFSGHRRFYRGRDEIPLYADYFYRLDHEAGVDVSNATLLEGLLASFQLQSSDELLTADGEEQLVFLFDLSDEHQVKSVEVEAVLANDYRAEVALLTLINPRGRTYNARYRSTFYRTLKRAPGNVRDQSNLGRVRLPIGEDTGIFTYSADVSLLLPNLELNAEYARSSLFSRYPAEIDGAPAFDQSPRFSRRGSAYFINAVHRMNRGRVGAELFSINPGFATSFRTTLDETSHNLWGAYNETVYWDLVEDNDDGDRYPDRRIGSVTGAAVDFEDFDLDGVFLAQDDDKDGFPEVNRDGDRIPDFDEPFLMFDVEPNIYVYGLDRNNNDEPDKREDDGQADYPYDPDQRGYHLFARIDLSRHLAFAVGRYQVNEVAGNRRNHALYALATFDVATRDGSNYLFFENSLRRVQDDIPDEFVAMSSLSDRTRIFSVFGLSAGNNPEFILEDKPPIFSSQFVADILSYQSSNLNES